MCSLLLNIRWWHASGKRVDCLERRVVLWHDLIRLPTKQKTNLKGWRIVLVRMRGFEPPQDCSHWHLKPACLPFHHLGKRKKETNLVLLPKLLQPLVLLRLYLLPLILLLYQHYRCYLFAQPLLHYFSLQQLQMVLH